MPNMDLLGWLVVGFIAGALSSLLFRIAPPPAASCRRSSASWAALSEG